MDTSDTLDSIDQDMDGIKSENGSKDDDLGVKSGGIKKQPSKATIRRRNNARIKKLVAPKAPIQVLNELVGPGNVKFNIQTPNPGMMGINSPRLLIAEVVVEGQTFSGSGPSKAIAKNIAAEAAVHYVVMQRNKEEPPEDGGRFQDTTPWGALASLALFKLFNDWQSGGFALPADLCTKELESKVSMKGAGSMGGAERMLSGLGVRPDLGHSHPGQNMQGFDFTDESGTFHTFSPEADTFAFTKQAQEGGRMGPNMGMGGNVGMRGNMGMGGMGMVPSMGGGPNMGQLGAPKHPVSLLHEKRGRENPITYTCSEVGELPNKVFTISCEVDGKLFSGEAKSKKEAKKIAAIKALAELYEIQY